ncbi:hypothetical protein C8Q80DRAFT_114814 [Daedaleopsis nitida]|nr:hypothetical protein C8Q80DRAFT_114814 [Daedaleopsis nitida]
MDSMHMDAGVYTAVLHALQYPYEQSEDGMYYSEYDDAVHEGQSHTGYSIWDTYRAAWAWKFLLAPERIPGMVQSILNDYRKEDGYRCGRTLARQKTWSVPTQTR